MGCNISTHPRASPQRPDIKIARLKSIHTASPTSGSKTSANSPHHDSQQRPASSGASNAASQNWSGVTFGALDVAREEYSWRNMRSPSIGLRLSCNGDLTRRRDSPEASPLLEGAYPSPTDQLPIITYSSDPAGANIKQSERFLTVRKKSEFFNEMMSSTKALLKLNTCEDGLQPGLLSDKIVGDQKTFPRSMDDIQTCTNLVVISDQEIRPGTPAFKPNSTTLSSRQIVHGETEPSNPEKIPLRQDQQGFLQVRQENSKEIKSAGHSPSNQGSQYNDKELKYDENGGPVYRSEKASAGENNKDNKVQLGKMFTQNLLDLVSPKRPKVASKITKKTEPSTSPKVEKGKRQSTEFGEDLSLSLVSNIQAGLENKKSPESKPRQVGPIGLNKIGFFSNDEMISPINNNARQEGAGYVTPPFLNQTSFIKHIFGDAVEEKGIHSPEVFSTAEFGKYSFLVEGKEGEPNSSQSESTVKLTNKTISK